jgi:hypothetical protein
MIYVVVDKVIMWRLVISIKVLWMRKKEICEVRSDSSENNCLFVFVVRKFKNINKLKKINRI